MTIALVSSNNTVQVWTGITNQVVNVINALTDGVLTVNGSIIFTNAQFSLAVTSMNVANNLVLTGTGNTLFLQTSNAVINGSVFVTGVGNALQVSNSIIANIINLNNGINVSQGNVTFGTALGRNGQVNIFGAPAEPKQLVFMKTGLVQTYVIQEQSGILSFLNQPEGNTTLKLDNANNATFSNTVTIAGNVFAQSNISTTGYVTTTNGIFGQQAVTYNQARGWIGGSPTGGQGYLNHPWISSINVLVNFGMAEGSSFANGRCVVTFVQPFGTTCVGAMATATSGGGIGYGNEANTIVTTVSVTNTTATFQLIDASTGQPPTTGNPINYIAFGW